MSNPNPTEARKAKRQKRREAPGTLEDARALLWKALQRAAELLSTEDPHLSLKAVHAVSQCAGSYAKVIEVGELEARLAALEAVGGEGEAAGPRLSKGAA